MKTALLAWLVLAWSIRAQDTVTIPKARLQELERKEAELEKLKGELSKTKGENIELKKQHETDAAKIIAAPVVEPHISPAMATLPPLNQGETVSALDLAGHYRTDAAAADQRYRGRIFRVQGQVASFEKPHFIRPYYILLKTADSEIKVLCEFMPPESYSAVFTTDHGAQLVGQTADHRRISIAKTGQELVIEGKCKGLGGSVIVMSNCAVK